VATGFDGHAAAGPAAIRMRRSAERPLRGWGWFGLYNEEHQRSFRPGIVLKQIITSKDVSVAGEAEKSGRLWHFGPAGLLLAVFYAVHLVCCQNSPLPFMDDGMVDSDMHANLLWAADIREQGWLDPTPHHPYNAWMRPIAPYDQWVRWWGGGQVFQQSPLYAYLLSFVFLQKPIVVRLLQALLSAGTCVLLGLLTARISGRAAGWVAFWLAALYAPFYAYTWPLLRDGLGWFIMAALLWALAELTQCEWSSGRARRFAWVAGGLLGLGYLARETFLLLIPVVWVAVVIFAWKRRCPWVAVRVGIATVLAITPLMVRNCRVGAPLLSSSNRFAEAFIEGNAGTAHPYLLTVPDEMGPILYQTEAKPLRVVRETIASHKNGVWGWIELQGRKLLSLFDPYESPDNLSFYFLATISPMVRFGLQYWMILVPGIAGIALSVRQRRGSHLWLWLFLPITLAGVLVGVPVSRYRQSLAILLIPWAAGFLVQVMEVGRRREWRRVAGWGVAVLAGWLLVLGPLARQPRREYERPYEYQVSADIYRTLGQEGKCREMEGLIREKFREEGR
jgi:4-amino-4-deoxy-L-arabinose transferase-like glycosyltransferase